MKCLGVAALLLVSTVHAQTNVISLNQRPAHFVDVKGKEYNVVLVRATVDGLIYSVKGGGGVISYASLSSATLETLGVPTNFVVAAINRAAAKKHTDARLKADYAALGADLANQREYQKAMAQATATYESRVRAWTDKIASTQNQIQSLDAQIANDKIARDRAWDYYVYTDNDYVSVTSGTAGTTADSYGTRLQNARAYDTKIMNEQTQHWQLEQSFRDAQNGYDRELPKIEADYVKQMKLIQAYYTPAPVGSAP